MPKLRGRALPHQYKFITSKAKYVALVSGLGAGKTEALIYKTLYFISTIPNASIGIFEPTYDLIRSILYPRFEEIFATANILYKLNKSEGIMDIWINGGKARLTFKSMDNPSRIIGAEYDHSLIDEFDVLTMEKAMDVWIRVIARTRRKFKNPDGTPGLNTVSVSTTPEGFRATYTMWVKDHKDNPEYELIRGRTMDNHHLPSDYVQSLERTYSGPQGQAYLLGEFVNMKGLTVYSNFDRFKSHTDLTIDDFSKSAAIYIGMDANVGNMAAIVIMKAEDGSRFAYAVDEFVKVLDTPQMINAITARYPGRQIVILPDSSMGSRKSVDASKSDIKLLREAGFRINAPKRNGAVKDRVLSMNNMFMDGEGNRSFFVNTDKCKELTECLEKQVYDDNGIPVKTNDVDHTLDACGYALVRMWGINKPTTSIARMRFGI